MSGVFSRWPANDGRYICEGGDDEEMIGFVFDFWVVVIW